MPAVPFDYDSGAAVELVIDAGQTARRVSFKDKATGDARAKWVAVVGVVDQGDGTTRDHSLWMTDAELGALADVLPDAGSVVVLASYQEPEGAEDGGDGRGSFKRLVVTRAG